MLLIRLAGNEATTVAIAIPDGTNAESEQGKEEEGGEDPA